MVEITSRDNETVKYACRLGASASFRGEEGLFLAEGKKLCMDLAQTLTVTMAFFTQQVLDSMPEVAGLGQENYLIQPHVAEKLSETRTNQGLFCVFAMPAILVEELEGEKGLLLCEQVQDPANIGTILRSAAAFGYGGVVLSKGCADPFSPKALRASMGAVGRIPVLYREDLLEAIATLQKKGVQVLAAALQNASPLGEVAKQEKFALLIGSEGQGLTPEAIAAADRALYIPMQQGVESLNAAAAASVLLYHFSSIPKGN